MYMMLIMNNVAGTMGILAGWIGYMGRNVEINSDRNPNNIYFWRFYSWCLEGKIRCLEVVDYLRKRASFGHYVNIILNLLC